jgi:hypothetical protein
MKGRKSELKYLKKIVDECQETDKATVAITGIGGIGYVNQFCVPY